MLSMAHKIKETIWFLLTTKVSHTILLINRDHFFMPHFAGHGTIKQTNEKNPNQRITNTHANIITKHYQIPNFKSKPSLGLGLRFEGW